MKLKALLRRYGGSINSKASCGHPSDWAMSGVSGRRRWGRTAGCGCGLRTCASWTFHLNGKFPVCGGGRGVDSVQFSV